MSRARITVADVLVWLFAVAAVGGLYPVYSDVLGGATYLGPGETLVMETVAPLMVLVLLASMLLKAGVGPGG